jgi:hypothetical protein
VALSRFFKEIQARTASILLRSINGGIGRQKIIRSITSEALAHHGQGYGNRMETFAEPTDHSVRSVSSAAILEQLERLLASPSFQNSKRYPKFLKFIVEKSIYGSSDELKERVIGVEVFERVLGYEPATDPVVRLVAGEIRKRLAQYYLQTEHENELRIDIPAGSYVPVFHWPRHSSSISQDGSNRSAAGRPTAALDSDPSDAGVRESQQQNLVAGIRSRPRRFAVLLLATITFLVLPATLLGGYLQFRCTPDRQLDAFWNPVLSSSQPTMICVGDWANVNPASSDRYVGPYDLAALSRLASLLGNKSHPFSILMASTVTLTDLRTQPGILIGSANNKWTSAILSASRFQFLAKSDTVTNYIVDTQAPQSRNWMDESNQSHPAMPISQEIGMISRVTSPTTGQVELVVAGIGRGGTTAASEFVTNPDYFKQFTDRAPHSWNRHNIQIIVSTSVINGRSGPPHMVLFDLR